ncbi:hypothetical protein OKA04_01220 [Luteolibacter flavescens]|uniref:Capsular polysaccharide biosynthesis protein n=1 Tax=Luteolibacter flavescens TaxID=1859460 RepID=A0ABT3FID6_9BACT|nr:hypothetical protein [Luteolibacter flavescens]MCW1883329.1 hypothetical protein [Luteolibacter flavescens]
MPLPSFLRPKDSYITCRDRDDGGGAQISARISAMICAKLKGLTYAHSPVADVAHVPAGTGPVAWSQAWEDFFNLGAGEVTAAEIEQRGYPLVAVPKPHRFLARSRRLHVVAHCHKLTDKHPEAWAEIAPVIRAKYSLSAKPELSGYDDGKVQVAVHMRRGDVGSTGRFSERFTADDLVLARLKRVLAAIGPDRAMVRLFSQGQPEDFRAFTDLGVRLHLDDDVFESFHHFVRSDVLFVAKSTFSYLGGVIGGNVCLYEPFRHPRLPGWLEADFEDAAFRAALERLRSRA